MSRSPSGGLASRIISGVRYVRRGVDLGGHKRRSLSVWFLIHRASSSDEMGYGARDIVIYASKSRRMFRHYTSSIKYARPLNVVIGKVPRYTSLTPDPCSIDNVCSRAAMHPASYRPRAFAVWMLQVCLSAPLTNASKIPILRTRGLKTHISTCQLSGSFVHAPLPKLLHSPAPQSQRLDASHTHDAFPSTETMQNWR
jgi:hypothetical protein